jgi:hypothetical protein
MRDILHTNEQQGRHALWAKRLGMAGFLFFFAKGLLWLTVPSLLVWLGFLQ